MTAGTEMRIRSASAADVPTIRAIALETWPVAYGRILSSAQLAYMLDLMYSTAALQGQMHEGQHFLIVERDGTALGFASAEVHHAGTKNTRLNKLYVLPAAQGTGAGRTLLAAVEQLARNNGNTAVHLNVNKYNPAQEFYRKLGYAKLREEVIDIGQGYVMDDFVLAKPL